MRLLAKLLSVLTFVAAVFVLTSCSASVSAGGPGVGNGPPAHAKAYGLRSKQPVVAEVTVGPAVKVDVDVSAKAGKGPKW